MRRKEREESKDIGDISITFEENITENEVKSMLEGYDLILPYELKFNLPYYSPFFYVIVSENTIGDIKDNLRKKNIFLSQKISKKRNDDVIIAIEGDENENELRPIMNSYGLFLKKIFGLKLIIEVQEFQMTMEIP